MYIIKFERNAKDGLKSKMLLENDNAHLMLKINPELSNEEEKKQPVVAEDLGKELTETSSENDQNGPEEIQH